MALTVTTDLTRIADAESTTNWVSYGAGGSGAMALEPDFYAQGQNCISRGVSGAVVKGMCYDVGSGATIDFTTGTHKDKLVYIWMRTSTPGLCATREAGGIRVILGSGTVTPGDAAGVWSAWYVDGSDSIKATEGWTCYVIDPQSTPSTTYGGGVSLTAVQYFGGVQKSTSTAKGQNFGVDAIGYGRGELRVTGTITTAGEGFKEITAEDFGTVTNRYGIITEKAGIYYVKGKVVIGHATSDTTFSSYGETVVWETSSYYNSTNGVVKAIPDGSSGGTTGSDGNTTYNGLAFIGGSGTTAIDFGIIVGTDSGRSGTSFLCPANLGLSTPGTTLAKVAVDDSTMALNIYGSAFVGFEGGVDLKGTGVAGDDCFNNAFRGSGRVASNMEIRNCTIANSVAAADDGSFIWESGVNIQKMLFSNNSRAIVFESTTGTPFAFTNLNFAGNTYDVRNESGGAITINVSGGGTPTYEDIGGGSATTVSNVKTLTIQIRDPEGNLITDACEVTVVKASDTSIQYAAENVTTGSTQYQYNYTGDITCYLNFLNIGQWEPKTISPVILGNGDQTVVVQLDKERGKYNNP